MPPVRIPEVGSIVRYRDDRDTEGPARVTVERKADGRLSLASGDGYDYAFHRDVAHGDVRTQAGVWSWPDEVGKGEGQSRWAG